MGYGTEDEVNDYRNTDPRNHSGSTREIPAPLKWLSLQLASCPFVIHSEAFQAAPQLYEWSPIEYELEAANR